MDNHFSSQARGSYPCLPEGDEKICRHLRYTYTYRHDRYSTTTFPHLNANKIWRSHINTQPLRVIFPTDRYENIYRKRPYAIPPVVALYDDPMRNNEMRTEVNQVKQNHKANRNDRALYDTANMECKHFDKYTVV